MKVHGDSSVKQRRKKLTKRCKKKISSKKINYKNVKIAVEKMLIKDLSDQKLFKKDNGTYSSLFHVAVKKGKKKLIDFLLEQGINLNSVDRKRSSLLKMMTMHPKLRADLDLMKRVINAGADVNHPDLSVAPFNLPHLTWLIEFFPETAPLFIQNGADVHRQCACGGGVINICLPLPAATQYQRHQIIDLLLLKRVDVNKHCEKGPSALLWTVMNNNISLTNRLLNLGAYVNEVYCAGETVLHLALEGRKSEIVQLLISHELINLGIRNHRYNGTDLHVAVRSIALNCIDFVLDANPDVNLFDEDNKLAVQLDCYDELLEADMQEIKEKLKKHLVRLRAAGFHLIDGNLAAISGEKYQDLYAECCQQVNLMKETPISSQSHLNFYDLLFINERRLSLCLESLDDRGIMQSGFEVKFSMYAGMILYKLNKAYGWIKLREALNEAVNILFNNDLPVPIMAMLYNYFTVYELRNLRTYLEEKDPGKSNENLQHSNSFHIDYDD